MRPDFLNPSLPAACLRCLLGGIALAFAGGCHSGKLPEDPPAPLVTVAPAQERKIQDFVVFTGRTDAVESVDIRARVSGYLTETLFKDGQEVKKGDVLFVIDPRPYQADCDRAKAEFSRAEADARLAGVEFNRAKELRDKNTISAADFDIKSAAYLKAQGGFASAKAALETAQLNLEFTTIKTPIDGITSRAAVTPGNLVTPEMSAPLTVVVSQNPVYAYAELDERQLLRYVRINNELEKNGEKKNGDPQKTPIFLQLADEKDFPHLGYIDFSDNRINRETGTLTIRGVFENKEDLLGPGLFVRLRFPGGVPYQSLLVPQEAIGTDQGQKFLFVVGSGGLVEYRQIEPGALQDDGWRAVKGHLKPGEIVIVDGLLKARPGQAVRTEPWQPRTNTPASEPAQDGEKAS
jgi:multidrug efflux system membrane fusion protein